MSNNKEEASLLTKSKSASQNESQEENDSVENFFGVIRYLMKQRSVTVRTLYERFKIANNIHVADGQHPET